MLGPAPGEESGKSKVYRGSSDSGSRLTKVLISADDLGVGS